MTIDLDKFKFLADGEGAGSVTEEEPEVIADDEGTTVGEEDEEDTEREDDEEDEDKDKESEEEDEEELSRVSYNDIKKEFPDFFKKFPDLKHAFFREQEYTAVFPTVEEARKAAEDQAALQEITESVLEGDVPKFLGELRREDPESLERFVNNFLPAVQSASGELYYNIVAPRVQASLRDVFAHGMQSKDENIANAAKVVHKILFGGDYSDIERDLRLGSPGRTNWNTNGTSELDQDKQRFYGQKYNSLYSDVTSTCYTKLDEAISKGLSDLDKSNKGLKRVLMSDIKAKVLSEMDKDTAHLNRMNQLWKRESRTGYSGTLKGSFETTFMAKAKTLIPKIRAEARKEVLGKSDGARDKKDPTRLTGGKDSKSSGKGMTLERARAEKLTTRQVFGD